MINDFMGKCINSLKFRIFLLILAISSTIFWMSKEPRLYQGTPPIWKKIDQLEKRIQQLEEKYERKGL